MAFPDVYSTYPNNAPIVLDHPPSGLPRPEVDLSHVTSKVYKVESEDPFTPVPQTGKYRGPCIPVGSLSKSPMSDSYYPAADIAVLEKSRWILTNPLDYSDNIQVFVLPSDVHAASIQTKSRPKSKIKALMSKIDTSSDAWDGLSDARPTQLGSLQLNLEEDDESLWYIFNTLQDPNPDPSRMKSFHSRHAMEILLDESDNPVHGLNTALYPYQRRSAATMVQREAQPAMTLDPRLQALQGPTGKTFYYDKVDGTLLKGKRLYSEACGGILAESMGCGKTLICLAVILATRGHFPSIPIEYQTLQNPIRKHTGSLMQMAAATAGRFSVPWKLFFESLSREGEFHDNCVKACTEDPGSYIIPPDTTKNPPRNSTSTYTRDPAQEIRLCSGTIVIVPPNMVDHWESEIATHTSGLKVVALRKSSDKTPTVNELIDIDLLLFSRNRFEQEVPEKKHVQAKRGKPAQEDSPLLSLHWLRVIVDEGHNVAGQKTRLTDMLKRLHFERRWVISGTPSPGLYGVEVSLASQEADTSGTESPGEATQAILNKRKRTGNAADNELKALDHLREMVIHFLDLRPWSSSSPGDSANWTNYMKPIGADGKRRKAPSLRPTLQSLVVRHRKDVVDQEKPLPKLYNKVTLLKSTFYDKLSINMFLFSLAVNAITSERVGPDYMFDTKNRKHLNQVIDNIRQAGFWWAGSTQASDSIDLARRYLETNQDKMAPSDRELLINGIGIATKAIESPSWRGFNSLHELGVFVENFPEDYRGSWAVTSGSYDNPLLMGISQACKAQEFVTEHLRSPDPAEGLSGAGIKARGELTHQDGAPSNRATDPANTPMVQRQLAQTAKPPSNKAPKKTFEKNLFRSLPENSPLKQTRLVGIASAKLRYLLDRVLEFHKSEKIIIFYEDSNTAYWTAQGLELINVEFRIYANTLKPQLRTNYLKIFRESEEVRVLLMDLGQASHGLHIAQASRVFIISPIWKPNIESQAIKRAHRIGQTRPVYVETLVLENTLEHRMLSRRKEMSEAELQLAEKGPLEDNTMSDIIQKEPFLPMDDEAASGMARLEIPTGFFDRHKLPIPDDEEVGRPSPRKRGSQNTLAGAQLDPTSGSGGEPVPKRPRVGFAENAPIVIDESSDSMQSAPMATASPAFIPVRPRVGFAEDVQITDGRSSPSPTIDGGREKRVSIFGP
ncbi:hypothetical protein N7541_007334 [Penicillium brevicompactum]|uniref:Helicase C-terminal domain-containing protein n=1 Tax=Penicillium brevicompactum TaxID=5074 RepID=A0A9W9QWY8_PENBR|nr:hypothetical protein N7541_007334 [Penicillium brevicompactum]